MWHNIAPREIETPVDLCVGSRVNTDAIGWTRRPLHRANLPRGRKPKRWEHWGLMLGDYAIGLTIADIGYGNFEHIYTARLTDGREWIESSIGLGALVPPLSDELPPVTSTSKRLKFRDASSGETRLHVDSPDVRGLIEIEPGGDALGVVISWEPDKFQYTLKDVGRRAHAELRIDGEMHTLDGWAILDRGRGIWPRKTAWNWGAGVGMVKGTQIGIQLGGQWTAGTGYTENALFVDGTIHYIGDELDWNYELDDPTAPWSVKGPRVEAVLTPEHRRHESTKAVVVSTTTYQAFGTWSGWARDGEGKRHFFDGLRGWAEDARYRW